MATIKRSKLDKIMREELEKAMIEEGILDTFGELGGDLKKWWRSADMRGDVKGSSRKSRRAIQATVSQLTHNLNKLRTKYGPQGERGDENVQARMRELLAQIKQFEDNPEAAAASLADASDGTIDEPESDAGRVIGDDGRSRSAAAQAGREKHEAGKAQAAGEDQSGEEASQAAGEDQGGEEASKLNTASKIVDNPKKIAQIVIATIKRAGSKKWPVLFTGKDPKFDAHFLTVLKGVMKLAAAGDKSGKIFGAAKAGAEPAEKAIAENKRLKLQISKTTLIEAIKLIQEHGI